MNYYAGQPSPAGRPVQEVSQVENKMISLNEALEIQQKSILELTDRLASILSPPPPATPMPPQAPKPMVVALAGRLEDRIGQVQENTAIIRSIIQRIEL
jgi:hypothetical protein